MAFPSLFRWLTNGPARSPYAHRRQFVPRLTALEDRSLPAAFVGPIADYVAQAAKAAAANPEVPFKETLTVVAVSDTGVISYVGNATHFGRLTAVLNPDYTFTKTASDGSTAVGFV